MNVDFSIIDTILNGEPYGYTLYNQIYEEYKAFTDALSVQATRTCAIHHCRRTRKKTRALFKWKKRCSGFVNVIFRQKYINPKQFFLYRLLCLPSHTYRGGDLFDLMGIFLSNAYLQIKREKHVLNIFLPDCGFCLTIRLNTQLTRLTSCDMMKTVQEYCGDTRICRLIENLCDKTNNTCLVELSQSENEIVMANILRFIIRPLSQAFRLVNNDRRIDFNKSLALCSFSNRMLSGVVVVDERNDEKENRAVDDVTATTADEGFSKMSSQSNVFEVTASKDASCLNDRMLGGVVVMDERNDENRAVDDVTASTADEGFSKMSSQSNVIEVTASKDDSSLNEKKSVNVVDELLDGYLKEREQQKQKTGEQAADNFGLHSCLLSLEQNLPSIGNLHVKNSMTNGFVTALGKPIEIKKSSYALANHRLGDLTEFLSCQSTSENKSVHDKTCPDQNLNYMVSSNQSINETVSDHDHEVVREKTHIKDHVEIENSNQITSSDQSINETISDHHHEVVCEKTRIKDHVEIENSNQITSSDQSINEINSDHNKQQTHKRASPLGFQTAGGKKIKISESSLLAVRKQFKKWDDEYAIKCTAADTKSSLHTVIDNSKMRVNHHKLGRDVKTSEMLSEIDMNGANMERSNSPIMNLRKTPIRGIKKRQAGISENKNSFTPPKRVAIKRLLSSVKQDKTNDETEEDLENLFVSECVEDQTSLDESNSRLLSDISVCPIMFKRRKTNNELCDFDRCADRKILQPLKPGIISVIQNSSDLINEMRMLQRKRIEEGTRKKEFFGTLMLKKRHFASTRIGLAEFLGKLNYVIESRVHKDEYASINSESARNFKFILKYPFETNDGGIIIPDNSGKAGAKEFMHALQDTPGVSAKKITESWTSNHFRWIVWKLASLQSKFKRTLHKDFLTPENVIQQLKYRYDVEMIEGLRSPLRKIIEGDESTSRPIVLLFSRIVDINKRMIEISDGWYGAEAKLDVHINNLIIKRRLLPGDKVYIHGMFMEGSPVSALDSNLPNFILSINTVRMAKWDAKLDFYKQPLFLPLTSLRFDGGGNVAYIKILVARIYAPLYLCTHSDGSRKLMSARQQRVMTTTTSNVIQLTRMKALSLHPKDIQQNYNCTMSIWHRPQECKLDFLFREGRVFKILNASLSTKPPHIRVTNRSKVIECNIDVNKSIIEQVYVPRTFMPLSTLKSHDDTYLGGEIDTIAILICECFSSPLAEHFVIADADRTIALLYIERKTRQKTLGENIPFGCVCVFKSIFYKFKKMFCNWPLLNFTDESELLYNSKEKISQYVSEFQQKLTMPLSEFVNSLKHEFNLIESKFNIPQNTS